MQMHITRLTCEIKVNILLLSLINSVKDNVLFLCHLVICTYSILCQNIGLLVKASSLLFMVFHAPFQGMVMKPQSPVFDTLQALNCL